MSDLNMDNLNLILRSLRDAENARVKVGILGEKAEGRREAVTSGKKTKLGPLSPVSNAEIGLVHEFGDPEKHLPVRSFLRAPIMSKMQKYLENSNAFSPAVLKKVIADRSIVPWLTKIGVVGENIVSDAFATGGFGEWPPSNMQNKKVHQTLVETQQLRNSITSEVTT